VCGARRRHVFARRGLSGTPGGPCRHPPTAANVEVALPLGQFEFVENPRMTGQSVPGAEEKGVMRHAANVRYAGYWGMSGLISDIVESTRLTTLVCYTW
jgi:hypothetical protein